MTHSNPATSSSRNKWLHIVSIGMLMIVVATLMPIFDIGIPYFRYVYAIGAIMTLVGRIMTPYKGDIFRIKRLYRIEFWSAIFFCVAAFFMFYPSAGATDWLAFTLAGGCLLIYTSIAIPRAERKAKQNQK